MEGRDETGGIIESPTDWESGNADIPATKLDYSRASHSQAAEETPEDQANSDLGNLGVDVVQEKEPAGTTRSH